MTLDDASDAFNVSPSDDVCADYLRTARQYWLDEMISDTTFAAIVERVAEWLADE